MRFIVTHTLTFEVEAENDAEVDTFYMQALLDPDSWDIQVEAVDDTD